MAHLGKIWFTALVIGVFCMLLAYISAIKFEGYLAFFLTGLGIAAALATRTHLIFGGLWPAWYLINKNLKLPIRKLAKQILLGLIPIFITVLAIMSYNFVRYGNIFNTGLIYHNMLPLFRNDFNQYGLFNIHFVLRNFYYQFIAYPFLAKTPLIFFMGGSLFLLSPAFLAGFWTIVKEKRDFETWVLVGTILLVNIPILTFMATGFMQFGSRFSMDFIVPLLLITAKGLKYWSKRTIILLVAISIFQFLVGYYLLASHG